MTQRRLSLAALLLALVSSPSFAATDCLSSFPEIFPVAFDKVSGTGLHASWCGCFGASVDVVRGSIGTLAATGGDYRAATERCLFDTLDGVYQFDDLQVPAAGQGSWYLLRGDQNGGCPEGTGSYDSVTSTRQVKSRDVAINTSGHDCECYTSDPGYCYPP